MSLRPSLRKRTQRIAAANRWKSRPRSKRKKSKRKRRSRLARGWSNLRSIRATSLLKLTIINTKMRASSIKLLMTIRKSFRQISRQSPLRPPLFNQLQVEANLQHKSMMIEKTNLLINPRTWAVPQTLNLPRLWWLSTQMPLRMKTWSTCTLVTLSNSLLRWASNMARTSS